MNGSINWKETRVALEGTHHIYYDGEPAYEKRFQEVLTFHSPGVAPVKDESGAYHIQSDLSPLYSERYLRTFGYYHDLAAVESTDGIFHIDISGNPITKERFRWAGNFQEGLCTVESSEGFYHIKSNGDELYPSRYLYAGDYSGGIAVVMHEDGLNSHIKSDGSFLHDKRYVDLDVFHKGFARAKDRDGWVHVDRKGKPIYSDRYAMIEPFYNGRARVQDFDGNFVLIDESGSMTSLYQKDESHDFETLSGQMVGFWQTQTIRMLVESRVFEYLPETSESLSKKCNLEGGILSRLLRAAGELGLVYTNKETIWFPTKKGNYLKQNHPRSLSRAALMWSGDHYDLWKERAGMINGSNVSFSLFDYFENLTFDEMVSYQNAILPYAKKDYEEIGGFLLNQKALDSFAIQPGEEVLEAGGGTGKLIESIKRVFPDATYTLLEKEGVIKTIPSLNPELSGINLLKGDLFENWNHRADRILMARVLHDWSDDKSLEILLRARDSLNDEGSLHIFEMILEDNSFNGGLLDINMHLMTGGKERSLSEWDALLLNAGFYIGSIQEAKPHLSILNTRKYTIKPHLKESIEKISGWKNKNVYFLLRHSIREDANNSLPSRDARLTPSGILLAKEFGELLQNLQINSVKSSPVPRCMDTASAVLSGAKQNADIAIEKSLGGEGFLISDGKAASDYWKQRGLNETIEEYVAGKTEVPGFVSHDKMIKGFYQMLREVTGQSSSGVHLLFTHDMYIASIAAVLFGKEAREMWPDFLEGFVVVDDGERLSFLYRGLEIDISC